MLNPQMPLRVGALRLFAAMMFVFAGCALAPPQPAAGEEQQDESDAEAPIGEAPALAPEPVDRSTLPKQELTENLLYEFLLAEIAGLLVAAGRYDEALPSLKKLLAGSANDPGSGFTQLTRTLANAQDKKAALKLVQALAADYPKLAEAHFALARAAVNAGDERLALEEARKAGQLRPEWEPAVLLEAQLVQKVSVDQAASLLEGYLKKNPAARETRLAYARLLVAQKRFGEARAEFQKLMAGTPDSSDMGFAVALLSLQLKDYDAAERYLRSLIDSPYRDKDGVRLYLGQVAEERKNLPEALRWYGEVSGGEQYVQAQIRYAQVLAPAYFAVPAERLGKVLALLGDLTEIQAHSVLVAVGAVDQAPEISLRSVVILELQRKQRHREAHVAAVGRAGHELLELGAGLAEALLRNQQARIGEARFPRGGIFLQVALQQRRGLIHPDPLHQLRFEQDARLPPPPPLSSPSPFPPSQP